MTQRTGEPRGDTTVVSAETLMVIEAPRRARWAATIAGVDSSSERTRESLSLGVGAITVTVVSVVTLVVFRLQSLPIAGDGSIGRYGAIASAIVAVVAFAAGRWIVPRPEGTRRGIYLLDVAALAVAHAVIALLTWMLVADIFARAFVDAPVFGLPVVIVAAVMAGVTAYIVFNSATMMRPAMLAVVLAVFFVEGVVASMLAASDPSWWVEDFSTLGVTGDLSAVAFNATLILAGFIVTTLGRYAPHAIPQARPQGASRVRLSLVVIGILLALVGALPADGFYWVHTGFAVGTAAVFAVLVAMLPRWIPAMPLAFVAFGWLIVGVLTVLFVLFAVGYYTLTAVELVAGALVLAWINLFIRSAAAIQVDVGAAATRSGRPTERAEPAR